MKYFAIAAATTILLAVGAALSSAQENRPHYRRSTQATVDAIDVPTRILELKRAEGYLIRMHVPDGTKNWESLKPGDTVKVTYNENVVTKVDKAGSVEHDREEVLPAKSAVDSHGSPDVQRIVTATIDEVDPKYGNITFTGPHGRRWMARVENPGLSKKLKAGDKVDLTYTQATLVSVE